MKTIDAKLHLMRLTKTGDPFGRGSLLDLHTLAFALSDRNYTLAEACQAFGVKDGKGKPGRHGVITHRYVEYNRQDVQATAALWERTIEEFRRHPIELRANGAFSAASIGKAYLRAMRISPPRDRLGGHPSGMSWYQVLGAGMVAYYGGRAECRIRRLNVPVVPADFTAMYSTVALLIGTWELLRSARIDAVEEPAGDVRDWIDGLDLSDCFRAETWARLGALVQVVPRGDILPVRARYSGADRLWGIGVNEFQCSVPLWYPVADAVASKMLIGRTPDIDRAIRIAQEGMAEDLREVDLLGRVPFDPNDLAANLFRSLVEERRRPPDPELSAEERARFDRFPKTLANATSYGIFAEMLRHELIGSSVKELDVHGLWSYRVRTHAPEDPGEFSFPPAAAVTTGGARLMLALLERMVTGPTGKDGAYAFCDTDSMAIVEVPGGPYPRGESKQGVRALTWDAVDRIRERFDDLNPYSRITVPHLLKLTDENFTEPKANWGRRQVSCFAISTKRYALSARLPRSAEPVLLRTPDSDDQGNVELDAAATDLVDAKEHRLAQLLNPIDPEDPSRDWITEAWEAMIRLDLSIPWKGPDWLDSPAVSRLSVSSPAILEPFAGFNGNRPYADSVKPFNFMLVAYVDRAGYPTGEVLDRFVPVAPYEPDRVEWLGMDWYNRWDPSHTRYRITIVGATGGYRLARVKTYRDILADYINHAESKSAGIDGLACTGGSVGLLGCRSIRAVPGLVQHVGKESNDLEGRIHRLAGDGRDYLNRYDDPEIDPFITLVFPVVKDLVRDRGVRAVARDVPMPSSTLADIVTGATARPRPKVRDSLTRLAGDFVHRSPRLRTSARDDIIACAAYLDRPRSLEPGDLTGR